MRGHVGNKISPLRCISMVYGRDASRCVLAFVHPPMKDNICWTSPKSKNISGFIKNENDILIVYLNPVKESQLLRF